MELKIPNTLSQNEKDFCELFVCGCDPYWGDARTCTKMSLKTIAIRLWVKLKN